MRLAAGRSMRAAVAGLVALSALAAWVSLGALGVSGPGPFTSRVGVLPPLWVLLPLGVGIGLAAAFVAGAAGRSASVLQLLPLLLSAFILLPWLPVPLPPAFFAWTGPVVWAIWSAALVAVVTSRPWRWRERWPGLANPRRAPWIAAAGAAAFFGSVAISASPAVPGGDEPHYLIITQSVLYDGDLKIENNHVRRDYLPYFKGTLRPDFLVRGKNGEIYSIHAPGMPVLIAPVFALGGYRAVMGFFVLVAAFGMALMWRLAYAASGDAGAAWFGTMAMMTATPIAFHSFTVYPDVPAGYLALTGVWALMKLDRKEAGGRGPEARSMVWLLHGLALAILPWIHTRFALIAAMLGLFILLRLPPTRGLRAAAAFLAIPVASAALWFWSFYAIYGTPNPLAPYGTFARTQASWAFVPDGLLGVLFDQQFGLLVDAPVFFVAFAGWFAALRGPLRRLALELAVAAAPYLVAVTHLRMWWGGWSAPVRFSVALLLLGGIFAAVAWRRITTRGTRAFAVALLLVSAFTTVGLAIVRRGRLAYNVRDGVSLWLEWLNPLADLPRGFPSFFRGPASALIAHSIVWLAALAIAWLIVRHLARARLASRGALALATGAALALAAMIALTVVWRLQRVPGITPAHAQMAVLRAASAEWTFGQGVGVRYRPFALGVPVGPSMRLAAPERWLAGRDRPLFALLGWVPAGRYDLLGPRRSAPITVRILRSEDPILTLQPDESLIPLPVDVPALLLHGPQAELTGQLLLQPTQTGPVIEGSPRAGRARRYGATVVFFLDDNAFPEPEAFWTRGASSTEVVLQPDRDTGRAHLFLRNGALQNGMQIESGDWKEERRLAPGEERELAVPLDARRGATKVRLSSESGFRPSAVDPKSTDDRYLGIWIQIRR